MQHHKKTQKIGTDDVASIIYARVQLTIKLRHLGELGQRRGSTQTRSPTFVGI
jgi:hypothetical protein